MQFTTFIFYCDIASRMASQIKLGESHVFGHLDGIASPVFPYVQQLVCGVSICKHVMLLYTIDVCLTKYMYAAGFVSSVTQIIYRNCTVLAVK